MSLVCNASFIIVKKQWCQGRSRLCQQITVQEHTFCEFALVHLPNWHFSLHLPPLQRPGMCAVYNFERLRFCSLPTRSQESVKQKLTCTIYKVNDTATRVLGAVFFNRVYSYLPPFPPNHPPPSLYLFDWGSLNSFSSRFLYIWSIHPSMDRSIDPLIRLSIVQSILQSIYPLIDLSIDR